jgi:hypothetical protein
MINFFRPNAKKIIIFFAVTATVVISLFVGGFLGVRYVFLYLFVLPFVAVRDGGFDSRSSDPYIVIPFFLTLWLIYFYPLSCLIYYVLRKKVFKEQP